MKRVGLPAILALVAFVAVALSQPPTAFAASAEQIDRDAKKALENLYAKSESAKAISEKAAAVLVFPGM